MHRRSLGARARRHAACLLAVLAFGAVLAGCGGGGKRSTTGQPEESTTTVPGTEGTAVGQSVTSTTVIAPGASETKAVSAGATAGTATTSRKTTGTTVRGALVTKNPTNGAPGKAGIVDVSASPTTIPSSAGTPQPGGTLTYLHQNESPTLDPVKFTNAAGTDAPRSFAIFGALVTTDPKTLDVQPSILESASSADGVVWTLKVRDGVKFSDGTPFDAAAIKFNWERIQDPANAAPAGALARGFAAMEPSGQLLKLTLKQQNNQFPRLIGRSMNAIGSPKAIQEKRDSFGSEPVGAGPFLFKEWVRDSQLTLVRNPAYWDAPRPYLDQLIIKTVSDDNQRINTFKTNAADVLYTNLGTSAVNLRNAGYANETSVVLNGATLMVFNTTRAPFNDVRARRAIKLGLDVDKAQREVFENAKDPVHSLFATGSPFYQPIELNEYNPAESNRLLEQLAKENGGPLQFDFLLFQTTTTTKLGEWIQAQFAANKNVKISLTPISSPAGQARVLQKSYDAAPWGFGFGDPEPNFANSFLSSGGSTNVMGFSDSSMDSALMTGRNSFDFNERKSAYVTVQRTIIDQALGWWVDRSTVFNFGQKHVKNLQLYEDGTPRWDLVWMTK
jgi:peptide/nickel transport system substrate-binding protein